MKQIVIDTYNRLNKNATHTARELGIARGTVDYYVYERNEKRKKSNLKIKPNKIKKLPLPKKGVKRYIVTSAQNNTPVFKPFWENLLKLVEYYDAQLLVASYNYNLGAYGRNAVKRNKVKNIDTLWYAKEILPYLDASDNNIYLAPDLLWCGTMNISPTAQNPLQGFETYSKHASGIYPHPKVALRSIPVQKGRDTKFNYTTGTVTQLNYIQKKAGLIAEHHHSYGALVVEVLDDGEWYVRQVVANSKGDIQDLTTFVSNGNIQENVPVEAITWGDIHVAQVDEKVYTLAWEQGGMLDSLRPQYQFFHDVLDFQSRNHHSIKDPLERYKLLLSDRENVEEEVKQVAHFLKNTERSFCKSVVVNSNHDNALMRWLKEVDWKSDLINAEFYLKTQLKVLVNIRLCGKLNLLEEVVSEHYISNNIKYLYPDESYIINDIEYGYHGDIGANGARGSAISLDKIGTRINVGHSHTALIHNGVYQAGTSSELDLGYNRGLSSWSHSHIITYPHGKRTIITMRKKWKA